MSTHPHANLIETQCHAFDTLEHLVGPITSVMAEMTDMTGKGYSTHSLALRFAQGAVGSLLGSYDSSYAYPDTQRLEINGTRGRVVVSDTVRRFEFQAVGNETADVWQAGYFNDRDREFHRTPIATGTGSSPPSARETHPQSRRRLATAHLNWPTPRSPRSSRGDASRRRSARKQAPRS